MSAIANNCGVRHMRLAGIMLAVVGAVVGAVWAYSISSLDDHDVRLRAVEQGYVRIETRLEDIQKSLTRIETKGSAK